MVQSLRAMPNIKPKLVVKHSLLGCHANARTVFILTYKMSLELIKIERTRDGTKQATTDEHRLAQTKALAQTTFLLFFSPFPLPPFFFALLI